MTAPTPPVGELSAEQREIVSAWWAQHKRNHPPLDALRALALAIAASERRQERERCAKLVRDCAAVGPTPMEPAMLLLAEAVEVGSR